MSSAELAAEHDRDQARIELDPGFTERSGAVHNLTFCQAINPDYLII
jgi:hypothetical protein